MRRLRIRTYALIGLYILLALPWTLLLAVRLAENGSFHLGHNEPLSRQQIAAMIAGLLAALCLIGLGLRKHILKPLEKLGLAARRIGGDDWDVRLPASRIAEIADVRDGFEAMLEGLRSSHRKQAELEEERRFVIAAVAHDLRTPLFALRGYLDGLEQGIAQSPEQMAKYVAVCKEKSVQLDRLVEDLFAFAKLEYTEMETETKTDDSRIDLRLVLRKAVEGLGPLARAKEIAVVPALAEEECAVRGDAHLLERAFANLLDNAARHTPVRGSIVVQCRRQGDSIRFAIRDTGPGFGPEELPRAFEPLYRGEQSRNRSTGGAGLGLTISRRILRRHGGELAAGNHPEGGALLSGWLPGA